MSKPVSMDLVKELRARTGIAVGKCKEALEQTGGSIDEAIDLLRKAGLASAVKKEGRETKEGMIAWSETAAAVALVEVNAETDFVVNNQLFQDFAKSLATQAAKKQCETVTELLALPSLADPTMTVDQQRGSVIQTLGENIQVRRLVQWVKGATSSIGAYSHMGGKIVVLVELEGVKGQEGLARDIAMHIAAEAPEYVQAEEVPHDILEREREIAREQVKGKPPQIVEKIVEGKVKAYLDGICLLSQKYIRDTERTVEQVLAEGAKQANCSLKVKRFLRWNVGAGL